MQLNDTICALSTAPGMGAIAVIRVSGHGSLSILSKCFTPFNKQLSLDAVPGYQSIYGSFGTSTQHIDDVLVAVFKNPKSYTGEDTVEISCHGSVYIQEEILKALLAAGCRMAEPGEFTLRAFFNGKMDLTQAEAVADLIASENKASHQLAVQQMRGGFGDEIRDLRKELIDFASLIELELDFGEEDVEFADREALTTLLTKIKTVVTRLIGSFETGNVLKNGVPVAIVGAPNVGKSTLLNTLLNEERAIVTEIAGTTRDTVEDELNIGGVKYRFIDTAGIRETEDLVESMGIKKTFQKIEEAKVVLYLVGGESEGERGREGESEGGFPIVTIKKEIAALREKTVNKHLLLVANKADKYNHVALRETLGEPELLSISAKEKTGIDALLAALSSVVNLHALNGNENIVSNSRHVAALQLALEDLIRVENGMANNISGDFLAMDIREALKHLGSIIGEVDTDRDILGNIFGKFCIGK
jgi:tRNA modification GTPase